MKRGFIYPSFALIITITSPLVAHANPETNAEYSAANQCRKLESGIDRLACFDRFIAPTYSENLSKLESRDQCHSEINGTNRLACYDRFYPPIIVKQDLGNWRTETETSPVDDSKNVYISLEGDNSFTSSFGETITPTLNILCKEGHTYLLVNWDTYLGLEETSMLHRLDKEKAINRAWTISTDTKAVFYKGNTIDFIKKLTSGTKLYMQITPYNENPVSTTFKLAGLAPALKPLQDACHWK